MDKPIRILQVFASLDRGGAETEVMNLYRHINKNKVQFDFVVNERNCDYAYETEIKSLGGRIFYVPRYTIINHRKYKKAWISLLSEHPEWRIVHGHHTSCAMVYLSIAHKFQCITIAHGHTAFGDKSIKGYLKYLMRLPLRYYVDYLFACSKAASDFMFGRNNAKVHILKNAINIRSYTFQEKLREEKRNEFKLTGKYVVGHIGNFSKAKNYPFLLKVFQKIYKQNNNAVLILIGKNESNPKIAEEVRKLELQQSVVFIGVRSDVPDLLQVMDIFLFPSLYEGLPVSLIEAQASGLKCIVSDRVSEEVKITDQVEFISLKESPQYWCDKVLQYQKGYVRQCPYDDIFNAGYEIKESAKWLEEFYLLIKVI